MASPTRYKGYPWRPQVERTQADRVLRKFGGPRRLARLLKTLDPENALNPSSIYRWRYPVEKGGTGGVIPTRDIPVVRKAAALDGIILDEWDLYPGPLKKREWVEDKFDGDPEKISSND